MLSVDKLEAGQHAKVCALSGAPGLGQRLAELGLLVGADVELIRRGNPCILRIHNTRFGLGQQAQRAVWVTVDA
jgi:Fe2+ transport system protein FeoA